MCPSSEDVMNEFQLGLFFDLYDDKVYPRYSLKKSRIVTQPELWLSS